MTHTLCTACGDQDARWPCLVCLNCRDELRLALSGLAEWYDAMLLAPVRGKSNLPTQIHREQPSPMNDRVGEVRFEILTTLTSWTSLLAETVPMALLDALTAGVPGLTNNLEQHEDWFLNNADVAEDYVHEVVRLADKAVRVAAPHRRDGVVIAWHESQDCPGGNVWARQGLNGVARCCGCDRTESVQWWFEAAPPSPDDLLIDTEVVSYALLTQGVRMTVGKVRKLRFTGSLPAALDRRLGRVATKRGDVDNYLSTLWTAGLTA